MGDIPFFSQRTETNARGWYDDELTKQTKDWKEGFDVGHVPRPDMPPDHPLNVVVEGYNQWPDESLPLFKVRDWLASGSCTLSMTPQGRAYFSGRGVATVSRASEATPPTHLWLGLPSSVDPLRRFIHSLQSGSFSARL